MAGRDRRRDAPRTTSVGWKDAAGDKHEADLSHVRLVVFEDTVPWRRASGYHGQRSLNGNAWLSTNYRPGLRPGHVQFDSLAERHHLFHVDFDHTVVRVAAQPMRLSFPDGARHVPDLFLRTADGGAVLVDVKPAERVADSADQFDATAHACTLLGWRYLVLSEPDPVLHVNVSLLSSCRFADDGLGDNAAAVLSAASAAGPRPLGTLVADLSGLGDDATVRPQVLHLLWRGLLHADLSVLLDDTTAVWVPHAGELDASRERRLLLQGHEWTPERRAALTAGAAAAPGVPVRVDPDAPLPPSQWEGTDGAPPWWAADWDDVPPVLRDRAERIRAVLNLLATGEASGDPSKAAAGEPDARYDRRTPRRERVATAGLDLKASLRTDAPVSAATVYRYEKAYARFGVAGLLDGRAARSTGTPESRHPEFFAACLAAVDRHADRSRPGRDLYLEEAVDYLADRDSDTEPPGRTVAHQVLDAALRLRDATGSTKRQRSAASVADRFGHWDARYPGEFVEIDHTVLDLFVIDDLTRRPFSVGVTAAVDAYTGCLLAYRLHAHGETGDDIGLLLHDMLVPPDDDRFELSRGLPWVGVPSHVAVRGLPRRRPLHVICFDEPPAAGGLPAHRVLRALPPVKPDAVVFDNGAPDVSRQTVENCDRLGITVHNARRATGSDKPHVERFFGTLTRGFCRWAVGYKGSSVAEKGPVAGREAAFTVAEVDALLAEWVVDRYHAEPRDYENRLGRSFLRMSPAALMELSLARFGSRARRADRDLRIELLRTEDRVIGDEGVRIDNLHYDSPDLEDLRNLRSPRPGGKWAFKVGTADRSRIWLRHPDRGFVEVPWRYAADHPSPLSARGAELLTGWLRAAGADSDDPDATARSVRAFHQRLAGEVADDYLDPVKLIEARLQSEWSAADSPPHTDRNTVDRGPSPSASPDPTPTTAPPDPADAPFDPFTADFDELEAHVNGRPAPDDREDAA